MKQAVIIDLFLFAARPPLASGHGAGSSAPTCSTCANQRVSAGRQCLDKSVRSRNFGLLTTRRHEHTWRSTFGFLPKDVHATATAQWDLDLARILRSLLVASERPAPRATLPRVIQRVPRPDGHCDRNRSPPLKGSPPLHPGRYITNLGVEGSDMAVLVKARYSHRRPPGALIGVGH
jgi:hypothetical protein